MVAEDSHLRIRALRKRGCCFFVQKTAVSNPSCTNANHAGRLLSRTDQVVSSYMIVKTVLVVRPCPMNALDKEQHSVGTSGKVITPWVSCRWVDQDHFRDQDHPRVSEFQIEARIPTGQLSPRC